MASTPEQVVCTPTFVFPAAFPETYGKLLIAEASSCYGFDPRQHLANFHATAPPAASSVPQPVVQNSEEAAHQGLKAVKSQPRSSLTTLKIPQVPASDFGRSLGSAPVAFPGIEPHKAAAAPAQKVEASVASESPKGDKLWPCPSCKVPFKAASELQQHLGQHTRSERAVGAVPCEVCGKLFASAERVRAHVRAAHGEKACACDICGSGFSYRCKLLDHMRTHTGDKPFRCEVCGKSFSQKNHLTRHAMIHTGERPFPCDFCGRGFYRKDKLARHRRVHTVGSSSTSSSSSSSSQPRASCSSPGVVPSRGSTSGSSSKVPAAPPPMPPQLGSPNQTTPFGPGSFKPDWQPPASLASPRH
ncbi:zinc finger protein 316-like isoform X3 [Dermacentor albipictus]|uniref:zinc finger protein 316-like isoform X3 n=1 Tax=Dermacentor albipictus TaxID=60249 RepID=UPI0038FCA7B2